MSRLLIRQNLVYHLCVLAVISPWDRQVNLPVVSIRGNLVFGVLLSCRGLGKVQVAGDRPSRLASSGGPCLVTPFHEVGYQPNRIVA